MDERILFERLHDALDGEPREGAYERLRIALTKSPAKPQGRPAFQKRWSKMGFRLAAGLAVVAVAAAIVAAFVATHNATTGSVPAGPDQTIKAYQTMVSNDGATADATWSAPCDTSQHAGCQADATSALVALQQWLDDLNRSQPPARFAVVDAQMRLHITGSIAGLNALLAASQAQDQNGMNRAYLVALTGRAWTDTVVPSILSSQQVNAAAYTNSVRAQKQALDQCVNCQNLLAQNPAGCSGNQTPTCQDLLDTASAQVATFQASLVEFAAPGSLSAKDARLEQDLANADTALIGMGAALSTGDQASYSSRRRSLQQALASIDVDATTTLNG